jgi:hypothetical protein
VLFGAENRVIARRHINCAEFWSNNGGSALFAYTAGSSHISLLGKTHWTQPSLLPRRRTHLLSRPRRTRWINAFELHRPISDRKRLLRSNGDSLNPRSLSLQGWSHKLVSPKQAISMHVKQDVHSLLGEKRFAAPEACTGMYTRASQAHAITCSTRLK